MQLRPESEQLKPNRLKKNHEPVKYPFEATATGAICALAQKNANLERRIPCDLKYIKTKTIIFGRFAKFFAKNMRKIYLLDKNLNSIFAVKPLKMTPS